MYNSFTGSVSVECAFKTSYDTALYVFSEYLKICLYLVTMENVGILQRSVEGSQVVTPEWAWLERTSLKR